MDMEVARRSERQRPPALGCMPWLVFPQGKRLENQIFCSLEDPNKVLRKSIPEWRRKRVFRASSYGWLLLFSGDCASVFNPASCLEIELPKSELLSVPLRNKIKYFVLLSSPPNSPDFTVCIFSKEQLIYCRGHDQQWTVRDYRKDLKLISGEEDSFTALAGFNGKLYGITYMTTVVMEFTESRHLKFTSLNIDPSRQVPFGLPFNGYLAESSDDELLYVHKSYRGLSDEIASINVMKLDFTQMEWVEVRSLKNKRLILGSKYSFSCPALGSRVEGADIYFTMEGKKNLLYAFNLEKGSISVHMPWNNLPTPWQNPVWVMSCGVRNTVENNKSSDTQASAGQHNGPKTSIEDKVKEQQYDSSVMNYMIEKEPEKLNLVCHLPVDVLTVVAKLLPLFDYMNFRATCRDFRYSAPAPNRRTATIMLEGQILLPWIMSFNNKNLGICKFRNPMYDGTFKRSIPDLLASARRVLYSKGNWVLMEGRFLSSLCSFNPCTGDSRPLRPWFPYMGIGFSTLPTSSDCITIAINWIPPNVYIYYMHQGEKLWHIVQGPTASKFKPYCNPVFLNGTFYFMGIKGNLAVFTVDDERCKLLENLEKPCQSDYQRYLAECGGELFSIFVGFEGQWVKVFRLNRAKTAWVKVESLGNYVLFVSNSSCYSAVARIPGTENRIYFNKYHCQKKSLVFYSLVSRKFHCISSIDVSMESFCDTTEPRNCCWIEPEW